MAATCFLTQYGRRQSVQLETFFLPMRIQNSTDDAFILTSYILTAQYPSSLQQTHFKILRYLHPIFKNDELHQASVIPAKRYPASR